MSSSPISKHKSHRKEVIAIGGGVFDLDLDVGEGVQKSFARGPELGRALSRL